MPESPATDISPGVEPFDMTIRVRYCECDPMNVAHHSVYVVWMEQARCEMLRRDVTSYAELEKAGVFFVVAKLNVRYRKPARFDQDIRVVITLARASRVMMDHTYEIYRDRTLLASAETTIVCVDTAGRPQSLPDNFPLVGK